MRAPCLVSIHALAGRATSSKPSVGFRQLFQFTPSQGGRPITGVTPGQGIISIHALAGRATYCEDPRGSGWHVSIHILAERATIGARACTHTSLSFNPHPRREGGSEQIPGSSQHDVSIHALARRATRDLGAVGGHVDVSIRALPGRATLSRPCLLSATEVSIRALAGRATVTKKGH